jgi:hypothetical protein
VPNSERRVIKVMTGLIEYQTIVDWEDTVLY